MSDVKRAGGTCAFCGDAAAALVSTGADNEVRGLMCRACAVKETKLGDTLLWPTPAAEVVPLVTQVRVTSGHSGDIVAVWMRSSRTMRSGDPQGAVHMAAGDGMLLALRLLTLALVCTLMACSGAPAGDEPTSAVEAPSAEAAAPEPEPVGVTVERPDAGPTRHADASADAQVATVDASAPDASAPEADAAQAVDAGPDTYVEPGKPGPAPLSCYAWVQPRHNVVGIECVAALSWMWRGANGSTGHCTTATAAICADAMTTCTIQVDGQLYQGNCS